MKYRRASLKLAPTISRRSDSTHYLDGFCLIVSIVKAQAHTTHRIEKKKAGHHWPVFFSLPRHASAAFRNAASNKKGSLIGCPFTFSLLFSDECHPERAAEGSGFPLVFVGRDFNRDINVSASLLTFAQALPARLRLYSRNALRALSFRAEPANFFFLLRSHEEVGRRSRGISLRLTFLAFSASSNPRSASCSTAETVPCTSSPSSCSFYPFRFFQPLGLAGREPVTQR